MHMISFSATDPAPPDNMTIKATLTWEYFFGICPGGWCCAKTSDSCWIVCDESAHLDDGMVFPGDDSFIEWLETVADEHLSDDPVEFLKNFCAVPELINSDVAEWIIADILQYPERMDHKPN